MLFQKVKKHGRPKFCRGFSLILILSYYLLKTTSIRLIYAHFVIRRAVDNKTIESYFYEKIRLNADKYTKKLIE